MRRIRATRRRAGRTRRTRRTIAVAVIAAALAVVATRVLGGDARVDPNGAIAEQNEDNNAKHLDIGYDFCVAGK